MFVPAKLIDRRQSTRQPEVIGQRILRGREVIAAGKATTTFTPSQSGREMLAESLIWGPDDPQTRKERLAYIDERVERFNQIIRESGLQINDNVVGAGVAMLIAQRVLTDNNVNVQRIENWKERFRLAVLTEEYHQGKHDDEKQYTYDLGALAAVQAMDEWKKATTARSSSERAEHLARAKEYANYVVTLFTPKEGNE